VMENTIYNNFISVISVMQDGETNYFCSKMLYF